MNRKYTENASSSKSNSSYNGSDSSDSGISSPTDTSPISRYINSLNFANLSLLPNKTQQLNKTQQPHNKHSKYAIQNPTIEIIPKISKTNIYNPPYDTTWFETERGLTLETYIQLLFQLVGKHLSCNLNKDTTKAILVPHAGIRYSGLCSASAYYELYNRTSKIERIVLLCTHHQPPRTPTSINIIGTTYTHITSYKPNGNPKLTIDTKTMQQLKPYIEIDDDAFQKEHAFFNQLPFIETVAPNASLIPLLIGNMELTLENNSIIRKIMQILIQQSQDKGTIVICTSDLSHVNGHFQKKINNYIPQNIRMLDSEILQFLYNIVNGIKTRTSRIDEALFMQNTSACGIMTMYLFGKLLNSISKQVIGRGGNNDKTGFNSRVSCYYTSLQLEKINIFDFDNMSLLSMLDISDNNLGSVSYAGIVFNIQYAKKNINTMKNRKREIDMICSEYEKTALLGLAREQLFYNLASIKIPDRLIRTIASPVFQLHLGLFTTLYKQGNIRGCIGTLETDNDEYTIESNIKRYILDTAFRDARFPPVNITEFNKLEFGITILYPLKPITLNEYFSTKFVLGHNGILIIHGKKQGYFLPNVATELGYNKQQLLEELCTNKMGNSTKECFRTSNVKMFYNEGIEICS